MGNDWKMPLGMRPPAALFQLMIAFVLIFLVCEAQLFTNHWAVRISGGQEHADRIAEKYGFLNMGQIGGLKDHYHFQHPRIIKRSTVASREKHSLIATESKVKWIQQQVLYRRVKRISRATETQFISFNDPKWDSMWYIRCDQNCTTDMNIRAAWSRGYTGKGVVVSILDDGVETQHPDLKQNYDAQASYDFDGNDADPSPQYDAMDKNRHGTRCAGVVAATANNSLCTVGIAYNARIGGIRMLDGDMTDMVEAKSLSLRQQYIDIYSSSWGPEDDGKTVDGPGRLARLALENGIRKGRKGRGSIFVWASGNGGRNQDHCSCDGYTNSIYTISVGSTTRSGNKPWYLEECSSTLASTYSSGESLGIVTTDLRQGCTGEHSGTSASAPMVAGIIALTLEANPLLTWRDVQHIIVKTSRRAHLIAPDWYTNGAGNNVSHLYGFGLMDAEAMVKEAETWRQVPTQQTCDEIIIDKPRVISPGRVWRLVHKSLGCAGEPGRHVMYLEHVILRITITHPHRGDLSITLTSPTGTKSQLLAIRPNDHSPDAFTKWEFMTTHCWGERASGDWILEISDTPSRKRNPAVQGKLKECSLVLYGTSEHPYKRHKQPRSAEMSSEDDTEEYNRSCDPECSEDGCEGPGPHQCVSCLHFYLKFKNGTRTCLSQCPQGFWGDRKRCRKCYSTCLTCTGSRGDQCSSCAPGYYLDQETKRCVTSCGDGYYLDYEENACWKCSENCAECTSFSICTECPGGMGLIGNKCQKTCEPGTFYHKQKDSCEPCHSSCATCSAAGSESCTHCADGYVMEEWKCVSSCSQGFYPVQIPPDLTGQTQAYCRRCDVSCLACTGPGEGNCSECVERLVLQDGACVLTHNCADGEYQDERGNCHACDSTCLKCKGPKTDDCVGCASNRLLDKGRCVTHCSEGKYPSSGQCHVCDHSCAQCLGAGPSDCTSCDKDRFGQDRYLYAGECVTTCPVAHFHTSVKTCEPCPEHCSLCSSATHCLKCNSSYYLSQGTCTALECGEGEVEDPEYDDCMACEEGCKKCVLYNPKHCLSCSDGYYKYEEGCYKLCPAKTYAVGDTMTCVACERDCVSCEGDECHWCEADFFLLDGKCMRECPDGFYADEDTQECEECYTGCKTCTGPEEDECDQCHEGLVMVNGVCEAEQERCPAKTFLTDERECEACHPSCQVCWGGQKNQCTTCVTGRYLSSDQQCVTRCPAGSFGNKESWQCEACPQGCAQCQDNQRCMRCLSTRKSSLYLLNGQCVRQCSRGYYPVGAVCKSCAPGCTSCEQSATNCLSCQQPLALHEQQCVKECPRAHTLRGGECTRCPEGCLQCSEDAQCTKCEKSYLHEAGCVSECPRGFYEKTEEGVCARCHSDCESCHGPGSKDCDSCADPESALRSGTCVSACPSQTYRDSRSGGCMVCHSTCQACSGPLDTDCTSCPEGLRTDTHGRCATPTSCPSHHYSDRDGACHLCHKHCNQCAGPAHSQCLSCSLNHYLLNGSCIHECPLGFFSGETQRCEPCHPNCLSCTGRHSHECLSCRTHLYREGKECVDTCRPGHYADEELRVCKQCEATCAVCTQTEGCVSCTEGLLLIKKQGGCVSSCPSHHYHDTIHSTCEPCHTTCRTCTGKGVKDCISCHPGDSLSEGTCDSLCAMGEYYASELEENYNCKPCDQSCVECQGPGPQNCTACPTQFILATEGRCLPCCGKQDIGEKDPMEEQEECCNCTQTRGECVLSTNFAFRNHEELEHSGNMFIFITTSILLMLGIGAVIVFIARSFSKRPTPESTVGRGYEKLGNSGGRDIFRGGMTSSSSTSSRNAGGYGYGYLHEDQLVDLRDKRTALNDDDDEDDEDEDIVYMGQDGTVYRKFRFGQLGEDPDDQLEYDDESYHFK
ncbi:proprotein convertase subtilisin/kexin type 5 [Clarias gariepinus]|uniref:proprotein convertase subtilisin/kexin type 5 n=1 Tax=Clarias gariepinus TaxID=13013 RepID=UPI00234D64E7|nr:proprotein convertase subtilisin/kexin type 5 [Clarias gariepinus]